MDQVCQEEYSKLVFHVKYTNMSDTYYIKNLRCAYCGEINDFAEESAQLGCPGLPYTFEFCGASAFSELRKAARDLFSDGFSDSLPLAGVRPKPTVQ